MVQWWMWIFRVALWRQKCLTPLEVVCYSPPLFSSSLPSRRRSLSDAASCPLSDESSFKRSSIFLLSSATICNCWSDWACAEMICWGLGSICVSTDSFLTSEGGSSLVFSEGTFVGSGMGLSLGPSVSLFPSLSDEMLGGLEDLDGMMEEYKSTSVKPLSEFSLIRVALMQMEPESFTETRVRK